jgi:hypothetical protein
MSSDADHGAVDKEIRRLYGSGYRLGPWVRRGKRKRAEVSSRKLNDSDVCTRRVLNIPAGRVWFGGAQ